MCANNPVCVKILMKFLYPIVNNLPCLYAEFRSIPSHPEQEDVMKRITTVLKESEAMSVRKAVCNMAGAERVVITPLSCRMCGVDMVDLYSEKNIAESCKQVRFDVTADDDMASSIMAVIRKISHAGKIVLASRHDGLSRRVA
jgi:nitrogen regulatory protein PII